MTQIDTCNRLAIGLMFTATALLCNGAIAADDATANPDPKGPPQAFIEAASKPLKKNRRQLRPSEAVEYYRERIEDLEAEYGAYGIGIDEQLLGLATALQKAGAHEEAATEFRRAMLVNRVNEGLYSLSQIPMIERLIESQIALNQWEEANDNQQYLYWLHEKNYGKKDPRMLPVINNLSRWHLQSYVEKKGETLVEHLINATKLYTLAVDIISKNFGSNDLRLVDALRGLKATNYYLANYKGEAQAPLVVNTSFGGGPDVSQRSMVDHYRMKSFNTGKKAITRIVDVYQRNPQSPPAASAKAKVELGDWYMMFNKWHSARRTYGEAYKSLWDNGASSDEIEDIFGRPIALPALPILESESKALANSHITVSYDVTAFGKARNIKILRAYPSDKVQIRSKVRNILKRAKFRPRFEDGEAVATRGIVQRFVFD
ncbi:tetratricopeptide repeat protein [Microbulbifer variabilis]|uniref:Tetratricopeptide repeat protein n=1 Tax=Microbulbifer variabilis TaxID=266805 RepID=A0ABY4VDA9_9GAMM|nr:tetratricopeptide repeat protein [Microbulbifer variabilis]USD22214.1 tetratricopeptide repeat protein [Microbulbifer variabilis]